MSYQVLARKWRPHSFEEMVGQGHVVRTLKNALDHNRLHHAFLFTGTRGVGKTTVARVLAKSMNCEQGISSRPCGRCGTCREIDEGRFVDLIEVDAASRTKIDDTRELLENVQYAPTRGRYKVYLIDEVHMLSNHSFNALLKTLEEPPPHVKFLLATTDPQKLPVTILSRCLQFNLKRVPQELIAKHLQHLLQQEAIASEPAAVNQIARAADGSLRDALSLLDQAIAYGGGQVLETEVRAMLGTIEQGYVLALAEALAQGDGAALMAEVQRLAELAPDYAGVLAELISFLHRIALAQVVPAAVDDSHGDKEAVLRLAGQISREDVQLYYQIGLIGRRDLALAPDARSGFEMVMLRMLAFRPVAAEPALVSSPPSGQRPATQPAAAKPAETAMPHPAPVKRETPSVRAVEPVSSEWAQIIEQLSLDGMARQLAVNCALQKREGTTFHLNIAPAHVSLRNKKVEERLQQALSRYCAAPVSLVFSQGESAVKSPAAQQAQQQNARQQAAQQAMENDSNVKAWVEAFNARIVPDSIQPK